MTAPKTPERAAGFAPVPAALPGDAISPPCVPGTPPSAHPVAEGGTPSSRTASPDVRRTGTATPDRNGPGVASPSSLSLRSGPQEAAAGMTPDPVTGADATSRAPAPGRGRAPRTPAAGVGASPAPAAGLQGTGKTYTITLPAGMKLLSLNDRLHFGERHRRTQDLKRAACVMALSKKIPRLERVSVVVEYQPRDRRHRDADNIAASAKALIDGLRAGKILPEDDSRHVTEVTCRIGEPYPLGRLVLHLTEVTA